MTDKYPIPALTDEQRKDVITYCLEQIEQVDRADENIRKASNAHQYQWLLKEHNIQRIQAQIALMMLDMIPAELNPNTANLVISFAKALSGKLLKSEQKYGWSDGWKDADWQEKCRSDFHHHVEKGDPRDVAAYCAFMWYHNWETSSAPVPALNPVMLPKETGHIGNNFWLGEMNMRSSFIQAIRAAGYEVKS